MSIAASNLVRSAKRILVVDDEPDVRLLVAGILEDAGHRVDVAASGGEALERLAASDFDLLVLDIMMPGMDGWEVLKRLGSGPRRPVVVVVSAVASRERTPRPGVAAMLDKPFHFGELLRTCEDLLLDR